MAFVQTLTQALAPQHAERGDARQAGAPPGAHRWLPAGTVSGWLMLKGGTCFVRLDERAMLLPTLDSHSAQLEWPVGPLSASPWASGATSWGTAVEVASDSVGARVPARVPGARNTVGVTPDRAETAREDVSSGEFRRVHEPARARKGELSGLTSAVKGSVPGRKAMTVDGFASRELQILAQGSRDAMVTNLSHPAALSGPMRLNRPAVGWHLAFDAASIARQGFALAVSPEERVFLAGMNHPLLDAEKQPGAGEKRRVRASVGVEASMQRSGLPPVSSPEPERQLRVRDGSARSEGTAEDPPLKEGAGGSRPHNLHQVDSRTAGVDSTSPTPSGPQHGLSPREKGDHLVAAAKPQTGTTSQTGAERRGRGCSSATEVLTPGDSWGEADIAKGPAVSMDHTCETRSSLQGSLQRVVVAPAALRGQDCSAGPDLPIAPSATLKAGVSGPTFPTAWTRKADLRSLVVPVSILASALRTDDAPRAAASSGMGTHMVPHASVTQARGDTLPAGAGEKAAARAVITAQPTGISSTAGGAQRLAAGDASPAHEPNEVTTQGIPTDQDGPADAGQRRAVPRSAGRPGEPALRGTPKKASPLVGMGVSKAVKTQGIGSAMVRQGYARLAGPESSSGRSEMAALASVRQSQRTQPHDGGENGALPTEAREAAGSRPTHQTSHDPFAPAPPAPRPHGYPRPLRREQELQRGQGKTVDFTGEQQTQTVTRLAFAKDAGASQESRNEPAGVNASETAGKKRNEGTRTVLPQAGGEGRGLYSAPAMGEKGGPRSAESEVSFANPARKAVAGEGSHKRQAEEAVEPHQPAHALWSAPAEAEIAKEEGGLHSGTAGPVMEQGLRSLPPNAVDGGHAARQGVALGKNIGLRVEDRPTGQTEARAPEQSKLPVTALSSWPPDALAAESGLARGSEPRSGRQSFSAAASRPQAASPRPERLPSGRKVRPQETHVATETFSTATPEAGFAGRPVAQENLPHQKASSTTNEQRAPERITRASDEGIARRRPQASAQRSRLGVGVQRAHNPKVGSSSLGIVERTEDLKARGLVVSPGAQTREEAQTSQFSEQRADAVRRPRPAEPEEGKPVRAPEQPQKGAGSAKAIVGGEKHAIGKSFAGKKPRDLGSSLPKESAQVSAGPADHRRPAVPMAHGWSESAPSVAPSEESLNESARAKLQRVEQLTAERSSVDRKAAHVWRTSSGIEAEADSPGTRVTAPPSPDRGTPTSAMRASVPLQSKAESQSALKRVDSAAALRAPQVNGLSERLQPVSNAEEEPRPPRESAGETRSPRVEERERESLRHRRSSLSAYGVGFTVSAPPGDGAQRASASPSVTQADNDASRRARRPDTGEVERVSPRSTRGKTATEDGFQIRHAAPDGPRPSENAARQENGTAPSRGGRVAAEAPSRPWTTKAGDGQTSIRQRLNARVEPAPQGSVSEPPPSSGTLRAEVRRPSRKEGATKAVKRLIDAAAEVRGVSVRQGGESEGSVRQPDESPLVAGSRRSALVDASMVFPEIRARISDSTGESNAEHKAQRSTQLHQDAAGPVQQAEREAEQNPAGGHSTATGLVRTRSEVSIRDLTRPSQLMRSDQMQTLAEELSQGVRVVVNSELTHLVLRLDEQQLGRIAVDLVRQEHTVTAQFRVESPETMALLEASFGELRSLLGEQGVQIGELTVALDQGQREAPHHPAEETWIDREVPTGERIALQVAEGGPKGPRMFGYNTMELTA